MTVKGDLAASLVSKYEFSFEKANEIVNAVFEAADDPNFAYAYAEWCEEVDEDLFADNTSDYWNVINFLIATNSVKK